MGWVQVYIKAMGPVLQCAIGGLDSTECTKAQAKSRHHLNLVAITADLDQTEGVHGTSTVSLESFE